MRGKGTNKSARRTSALERRVKNYQYWTTGPEAKSEDAKKKAAIAAKDIWNTAVHLGIQEQYPQFEKVGGL
jgi:hypothetical protein